MRFCEFVSQGGVHSCRSCGRAIRAREGQRIIASCGWYSGPGTELHSLLGRFGLTASGDCKCRSRASLMDRNGCDWCDANIEEIVGWLRESAAERGLPFVDMAGRLLVRRAIANARRKEAARGKASAQAEGPAPAG